MPIGETRKPMLHNQELTDAEEVLAMFIANVLYSLNVIVWLALAILLVVLCYRTKSKGLILISAILFTSGIFDWGFEQVGKLYVDRSIASKMSGEAAQNMSAGEFLMTLSLIEHLLRNCLYALGGFLIYREWRLGKFRNSQLEHLEESKA